MASIYIKFFKKTRLNPLTGCIEWVAGHSKGGYGHFSYKGTMKQAHRVSWQLAGKDIPKGKCICHRYDNRRCVNTSHLFIGSRAENSKDMVLKGRQATGKRITKNRVTRAGEGHYRSKLTEKQVKEIRDKYSRKLFNQYELSRLYGVTQSLVSCITSEKTWKGI